MYTLMLPSVTILTSWHRIGRKYVVFYFKMYNTIIHVHLVFGKYLMMEWIVSWVYGSVNCIMSLWFSELYHGFMVQWIVSWVYGSVNCIMGLWFSELYHGFMVQWIVSWVYWYTVHIVRCLRLSVLGHSCDFVGQIKVCFFLNKML